VKFTIDIDGTTRQVEATADGTLVIDGQTFQVKVGGASGDKRTVQVGDKTYEVRVVEGADTGQGATTSAAPTGGPTAYVLEIAGERVPVAVTTIRKATVGGLAATTRAGEAGQATGSAAVPGAAGLGAAASSAAIGGEAAAPAPETVKDGVWAPVPGKIVDVRVKAGDKVAQGDLMLILEAMKMENELHAPKEATVAAVLVKKGDQAERGQLLIAFA
jgi:biotin carboxyl carrier protein